MATAPTNILLPTARAPEILATFAYLAVDGALWLVRESQMAIARRDAVFDPDPKNIFDRTVDNLGAIRALRDLTPEQRSDLFIAGFRLTPHTGPQIQFELLLARDRGVLVAAFEGRWTTVAIA